jgi:predicted glutamine amidotransferase
MCELFAMSSRSPTRVSLSLARLAARGAPGGSLADGWGVACYDGRDVRLMREPEPAGDSPWLKGALAAGRPNSRAVIAHIRHATQGGVLLANTQPFARELGGRMHVFAHNGMLPGVERAFARSSPRFRPVGETDSEAAFCALLDRLAPLWDGEPAPVAERHAEVRRFAEDMRALGPANFLYCDGEVLFAHGHRRKQADGRIAWPGLHVLTRRCAIDRDALPASGVDIAPAPGPQALVLFASVPLSQEAWRPIEEGDVVAAAAGEPIEAAP